ncbi:uncharacterized protein METZ01_LOCUS459018, partial [marine metagenome]
SSSGRSSSATTTNLVSGNSAATRTPPTPSRKTALA